MSDRPSTVRDVVRGGFYLGLEQVTMVIGGILYSIVVLRMLGPATYGVLTLGQAVVGLAGVLTTNIETYLERFVAEIDARGMGRILRRLLRRVLLVKVLLAIGVAAVVALLAGWIGTAYGYRDLHRLLPVLAPLIVFDGLFLVFRFTLYGLQRYRALWAVTLGNNIIKLVVVLSLWRLGEGVFALVVGLLGIQILTVSALGILVGRFLPRSGTPGDEVPTYRRIAAYVLPLYGARIFFLSGQHLNRLILGILFAPLPNGATLLGIASFALMTMERFIAVAASIPNALLPVLSRLRGEGRDQEIEQVVNEGFRVVAGLSVLVMAATFCLSREAVLITGGDDFLPTVIPLQIMAIVPLFRTLQQPLNMSFFTYERTRVVFWLAGMKFAIEPLAYLVLIPRYEVAGVAFANLLACVAVFGPALATARGLFPETASLRMRSALKTWALGGVILAVGWTTKFLAEPWPALPARIALLAAAILAIAFVRLVHADDLRRLGEVSRRPRAAEMLARLAAGLERLQGRSRT